MTAVRANSPKLSPYVSLPEPLLTFSRGDSPQRLIHPLLGVARFGPYAPVVGMDKIRVASITALGQQKDLFEFLRQLRSTVEPSDRRSYLPPYPGFQKVWGVDLHPSSVHESLGAPPPDADPHEWIVAQLSASLVRLNARRDEWDVVAFLLPAEWESARESTDGKYRLHDRLKAAAAPLGIPVQMLRQSSALSFRYLCGLCWRLSMALFVKAGGVPWRMEPVANEETVYVGLSYALRGSTAEFVTCCSQLFDAEGGGLEFVAYNVGAERDPDNPHLTRDEMRTVMARSARLYQSRHAGRLPSRVVLHKRNRWRDDEVLGAMDAWPSTSHVECLSIQAETPWTGVVLDPPNQPGLRSKPGDWPVPRGTMIQTSGRSALLWVTGTANAMSRNGGRYNPAMKALPKPTLFTREAGSGPLEFPAKEILALSKLDWNNDDPFSALPVTLTCSSRLATVIAHVPNLPDNTYPYRLFI